MTIELQRNKIKIIGLKVFRNIFNVNYIDLRGNVKINAILATKNYEIAYDEKITRCYKPDEFHCLIYKFFNENSLKGGNNLAVKVQISGDSMRVNDSNIDQIHHNSNPNNVWLDVQNLLKSDEFRDFTIKIDETKLKVHKFILIARCPTIAEALKNNPEADNLTFHDIQLDVFKVTLDYIYNDSIKIYDEEKLMEIYAAAEKLKLDKLKCTIASQISDLVDENNAIDILKLATLQNHVELKKKSFEKIKAMFPDQIIKDELIDDVEMLQKLFNGRKKLKKAEEEFQKLLAQIK